MTDGQDRRMTDRGVFAVLIVVICGVGFVSQWETVERWLSTVFVWLFAIGVGGSLLVWLVREAWDALLDWRVMGPPDLTPPRRRESPDREESR